MVTVNALAIQRSAERLPATVAVAADGIRIPRAMGGPVLDLDLTTMAEQLSQEGSWSDGRNSRTLVKHGNFRMILTVMREGACLHRHQARRTVVTQVLSGHIRARVLSKTIDLTKGRFLSMDPHLIHDVEAVVNSAILIMIAWPHDRGIVSESPADADRTGQLIPFCSIGEEFGITNAAERNAA